MKAYRAFSGQVLPGLWLPGSMTARCVRVARLHQTIGTSCSVSSRFDITLLLGA